MDPPAKSRRTNNVWIGSTQLLQIPYGPESAKAPATLVTSGGKERPLPPVPNSWGGQGARLASLATVHAPGGSLFGVTTTMVAARDPLRAPRKDFKVEVYRFDVTHWKWSDKPIGQIQSTVHFVPTVLSQDYLLGIASAATTFQAEGEDRCYPFAVFKRNAAGTYQLDHFEDAGLEKPAIGSRGQWAYPFMADLWLQANNLWVRDLSVIASGGGMLWSFGPEGQFRGLAKVYDKMDDAFLLRNIPWNGALLDYQPNGKGELIVSCLDAQAAVQARSMMPGPSQAEDLDSALANEERGLDRILSKWNVIQWYQLQVPSGLKTRIPTPRNVPALVTTPQDYRSFNWTFQPDGNIRMNTR
jgi:hypothetical protein